MTLLALDTSTSFAGIALARDGAMLAELNWHVGQRHSSDLLPRLRWLLDAHGIPPDHLTAVAVALGPGSFSGIRVALAAAKSLAFALRMPLIGVPTLDCVAWEQRLAPGPLWAILEAGRGQVYAARYATPMASPGAWAPAEGYAVLTPGEVVARVEAAPVLFCGEWREETQRALVTALGARARFTSPLSIRRAACLAELALARAAHGQYDDAARIEPLYLRRPAITVSTKGKPQDQARQEGGVLRGEGEERAIRG
ncbi:MAG: tRNA (adenosine(37)-N6)-threonylcarbamoyltransferase complex dimerization subunit type 1 TsaB [Ktedonobacterales bacterium]|nr:tRNA (adenosine(37)-N6)-threonylcarbamoyltransferase complex dimerization subunit type 1 TsaB [Ktedonobacterales bacterium]